MKKNLRTLGTILSLVAISSFTMTSCGEKAPEATTEADATEEAPAVVEEPVAPVEEPVEAPTCDGAEAPAETPAAH